MAQVNVFPSNILARSLETGCISRELHEDTCDLKLTEYCATSWTMAALRDRQLKLESLLWGLVFWLNYESAMAVAIVPTHVEKRRRGHIAVVCLARSKWYDGKR